MRRRSLVILALAAAAGACTMERESADDDTVIENRSADVSAPDMQDVTAAADEPGPESEPAYATPEPTPPVPVPDMRAGMTATGRFIPYNELRINASVTVSNAGAAGTLVSVAIYDSGPNVDYITTLNRGTCTDPGAQVAVPDMRFRIGPNGVAAGADTIPVPATTVMNGEHVLFLRPRTAGISGPPVACAPIPLNRPQVQGIQEPQSQPQS